MNKGHEPLEGVETGQEAGKVMGHLPGRATDDRQASPLGTSILFAEEQGKQDLAHVGKVKLAACLEVPPSPSPPACLIAPSLQSPEPLCPGQE